jgi:hypothetical protein
LHGKYDKITKRLIGMATVGIMKEKRVQSAQERIENMKTEVIESIPDRMSGVRNKANLVTTTRFEME